MKHLSLVFMMTLLSYEDTASTEFIQTNIEPYKMALQDDMANKKVLNCFVIVKRKKGRFDVATLYNVFRTKLKRIFHGKNVVSIMAKNSADVQQQIERRLSQPTL